MEEERSEEDQNATNHLRERLDAIADSLAEECESVLIIVARKDIQQVQGIYGPTELQLRGGVLAGYGLARMAQNWMDKFLNWDGDVE